LDGHAFVGSMLIATRQEFPLSSPGCVRSKQFGEPGFLSQTRA
jgi:hypothetical protein